MFCKQTADLLIKILASIGLQAFFRLTWASAKISLLEMKVFVLIASPEGVIYYQKLIRCSSEVWSHVFTVALNDFELWNGKAISQFWVAQSNCERIWSTSLISIKSTSDIYLETLINWHFKTWEFHLIIPYIIDLDFQQKITPNLHLTYWRTEFMTYYNYLSSTYRVSSHKKKYTRGLSKWSETWRSWKSKTQKNILN